MSDLSPPLASLPLPHIPFLFHPNALANPTLPSTSIRQPGSAIHWHRCGHVENEISGCLVPKVHPDYARGIP